MKYPPLQEPCLSCIYKCFRVEDPTFISDKNCRYAKKNIVITIKEDKISFFNDGELIDNEIINNLFERYKKGKKGENGIGLAIVKGNCNLLGYNVYAKNKKNGVEFIIDKRK